MKHAKRYISIFSFSITLAAFLTVIFIFNFSMEKYIENQAVLAIENEIKIMEKQEDYLVVETISSRAIQVNLVYLNIEDKWYTDFEKKIVTYIRANDSAYKQIFRTRIEDKDIYLCKMALPSYIYEDEETTFYDDQVMIIFANITPLTLLLNSMNKLFLVVLAAFTLFAGFLGIKIGKKIERHQEKLKRFFQNVSHELKTPIMSIQGYAEGIYTDVIKDKKRATQIIINESQKMSDLVEELLYVSKIDSGAMKLQKDPIDLSEFLYDCLRSVEMLTVEKGIELKTDFPDSSLIILADEKQLMKAFLNVLINAVKYTNDKIWICYRKIKGAVIVSIHDNGDGIDSNDLPYIFNRYYKGRDGNSGIGLALSKEIIELHCGEIEAINTSVGAEFRIRLKI